MATAPYDKIEAAIQRHRALTLQIERIQALSSATEAPGARCYVTVDGQQFSIEISAGAAYDALKDAYVPLAGELGDLTIALDAAAAGIPASSQAKAVPAGQFSISVAG